MFGELAPGRPGLGCCSPCSLPLGTGWAVLPRARLWGTGRRFRACSNIGDGVRRRVGRRWCRTSHGPGSVETKVPPYTTPGKRDGQGSWTRAEVNRIRTHKIKLRPVPAARTRGKEYAANAGPGIRPLRQCLPKIRFCCTAVQDLESQQPSNIPHHILYKTQSRL